MQTTFVPEIQDAAEAAVRDGLRRLGVKGLQAALVAMDPQTGNLLAMVGGSDFATTTFNRAVRSRRQPGSAFKPFVYAAALERGLSPVSMITGLRQVAVQAPEGVWIPRDERADEQDEMTLREALLESSNAAAVLLQQQVGSAPVLRLARDLGVRNQPDVPSLALGSGLVTPLDLTAAYAVFPTLGYRVRPRGDRVGARTRRARACTRCTSSASRSCPSRSRSRWSRCCRTSSIAAPARRRGGSACAAPSAARPGRRTTIATPGSSASRRRSSSACGWDSISRSGFAPAASGARVALPIWSDFMRRDRAAPAARSRLSPPADLRAEELCRLSYQRPVEGCPTYIEHFKDGDEIPTRSVPDSRGQPEAASAQRAIQGVFGALGRGIRGHLRK